MQEHADSRQALRKTVNHAQTETASSECCKKADTHLHLTDRDDSCRVPVWIAAADADAQICGRSSSYVA
jgi:hypothetical protein